MNAHAELAMEAARGVARARRKSQKEKMGHVVCHHLLCLLNAEGEDGAELPVRRRPPAGETLRQAKELSAADHPQISLGF